MISVKRIFRNRFLEILFFFLLYTLVGYFLNKKDPLLLNLEFSPLILFFIFIALFYGIIEGIFLWLVSLVASFLIYKKLIIFKFLWFLVLTLIAGYFKYHWRTAIEKAETDKDFYKSEAEIMRETAYLVKLSHDQLEFNYLTKPYSLRQLLTEVKNLLLKEDIDIVLNYISTILVQNFRIYKAILVEKRKEFLPLLRIGNANLLNLGEAHIELFKRAIDSGKIYWIPFKGLKSKFLNDETPKYLAIVPVKTNERIYLLAIEDINFLYLNEDTLISIYILLSYIFEDFDLRDKILQISKQLKCSFEFIKELYKMYRLFTKAKVKSSLVILEYRELPEGILKQLEYDIRALDMFCIPESSRFIIFLLPFTDYLGAKSFSKRILNKYKIFTLVKIKEIDKRIMRELSKLIS